MSDEEIEKEREQVKKLMGAKSAMEASLSRIKTLENALYEMHSRYAEIASCIGDGVVTESRYAKGHWTTGERQLAKVTDLKAYIDALLKKHTGPIS